MRTGYAIVDKHQHGWLQTRFLVEGLDCPITVWADEEEYAMEFRQLKDAKAMRKVIRRDHRQPDRVHIVDPRGRVIA